jgi:hypothetical protein
MLAPSSGGPLSECSASRHRPGTRSGNRALPLLSLERLPMSIRNGTSSSVNPQPLPRCRLGRAASGEEEAEEEEV